ncbi:CIA30 family protein [Ningiella sp. W23]|uniref:CIA30 family protein n=1 Tax=Ningiella sp. W23 TaxID=3023715 RepID=UPI0037574647
MYLTIVISVLSLILLIAPNERYANLLTTNTWVSDYSTFMQAKNNTSSTNANVSIDFTSDAELNNWVIVNDTVMGGRSRARIAGDGEYLVFDGMLSLENNGGFASIRRVYNNPDWQSGTRMSIEVQGDGRDYQFRLRTNRFVDGVAYVASFSTQKGETSIIRFTESDFVPRFRGRLVSDAPPLQFDDIAQLGFMLADKKTGAFALKLKRIEQNATTL